MIAFALSGLEELRYIDVTMKKSDLPEGLIHKANDLDLSKPQSWPSKARSFAQILANVTNNRDVHDAMCLKVSEALQLWAILKMGRSKVWYLRDALDTFHVLCALNVAQTNKPLDQAARDTPYNFKVTRNKKRRGFVQDIPTLFSISADYETTRQLVESLKKSATGNAHFRLLLQSELPQPLPASFSRKLPRYYLRGTKPSKIAQDYVGCRSSKSSANVKKMVAFAKDGEQVFAKLHKAIMRDYLPESRLG